MSSPASSIATLDPATLLPDALARSGVPGAVLGVATPGGGIRVAAAGIANLRTGVAVTPDTLFAIGSVTKLFTSAALLRLVDDGRVGLDDPIVAHLPEFRLADAAASARITLRHVLTHTAGIPSDHFEPFGRGDDCLERFTADLARLAPEYPAGATFSYSNGAFSLLGRLIERLTGRVFDAALRELVLDPLGLRVATLLPEEAILHAVAVGHYLPRGGGAPVVTSTFASASRAVGPEGMVVLPVGELLTFATRIRELLRPETLAEAHRPQVDTTRSTRVTQAWGLGWMIFRTEPRAVVGHDGSIGGQIAALRLVPERGVAIALLTNLGDTDTVDRLHHETVTPLLEALAGVDDCPAPPQAAGPATDLGPYVGTYGRLNATWTVARAGDGLLASLAVGEAIRRDGGSDVPATPLVPIERDVFALGTAGSTSIFVFEGEEGEPRARLFTGFMAHHRVG